MTQKTFLLRVDAELMNKLFYVADYEGRSANGQLVVLIRRCVEQYEKKYGPIVLGEAPADGKNQ